jgi:hypothetical protein
MDRDAPPHVDARQRLLGGWHDIRDDVSRLERTVASADGHCRCGHAAGANVACPCCAQAAGDLTAACDACTREVATVTGRLERVEEDALRFLAVVFELFARTPERVEDAVAIDHGLTHLLVTFRHVQAATDEWARGCRTTHLPAVKSRTQDLAVACRRFDDALRRIR